VSKDRPELRVVDGRADSVIRRQRFEQTHLRVSAI
jgi:hypothetical protein